MKFSITTLGCKVNAYESQYYAQQLQQRGYEQVGEHESADLVIINTCTVTNTAAAKSRQKIRQAKRNNPSAFSVVVGCYAQYTDQEIDADLVIGAQNKKDLVKLVEEMMAGRSASNTVGSLAQFTDFEAMPVHYFDHQHRAYLKIEDGCNQFCSYCAIPYARGRERSLPQSEVIDIAKQLANSGHYEIVLTGIHTGRYQDHQTNLATLLKALLAKTPAHVNYRISSIEITEVSDELIDLMKNNPRLLPHLHIPIQSACDQTLKRMRRPYTVDQFKERLAYIRQHLPEISISTDVITGFVQESEEEFEQGFQHLKEMAFSFLHVFPYSKRNGTLASQMKGEVDGHVKKKRVEKLRQLSQALRLADMARFKEVEVLIETDQAGLAKGYTRQYHPVLIHHTVPLKVRDVYTVARFNEEGYEVNL